jgi:acyl-coenzyme A synthetase/AMP-(fatty) acid ligase
MLLQEHPPAPATNTWQQAQARLKALVVLKNPNEQDGVLPTLRLWMRSRLTAPETPVQWMLGTALPRDAHGKLGDWPARRQPRDWA